MIIPPGFAQVTLPFDHQASSRDALVVFGVENAGAFTQPSDLADAVWSAVNADLVPIIDANVVLGPVEVRMNVGGTELVGQGADSSLGAAVNETVPANTAVLWKKVSGIAGRKNRGRMYLPWAAAENDVTEVGVISPSTVTDFQTAADAFLGDLATADVPMVILHNSVGTPTSVTSLVVDPLVATQRKRIAR